jgi:hypothetical protein
MQSNTILYVWCVVWCGVWCVCVRVRVRACVLRAPARVLCLLCVIIGNIVLCCVQGTDYLHLIKAIQQDRYQIGNNIGGINGWIGRNNIFGIVTKVEK